MPSVCFILILSFFFIKFVISIYFFFVDCNELGLNTELRVTSAHKGTEDTLKAIRELESRPGGLVVIAVAGRSNGLGPVLASNSTCPVINCPPPSDMLVQVNIKPM